MSVSRVSIRLLAAGQANCELFTVLNERSDVVRMYCTGMLTEERFQQRAPVDKRGRKVEPTIAKQLTCACPLILALSSAIVQSYTSNTMCHITITH